MAEGHEASHEDPESASGSRRKCQWQSKKVIRCMGVLRKKMDKKPCVKCVIVNTHITEEPDHLMRAHPSKLRPPEVQPCLNAYLSKTKCLDGCAKKITEHITDMVVHDLRSAAIVEGTGFKALINYIEPGYHVPSSTHIVEVARRKFTDGKAAIRKYMQAAVEFFVFTTDIWTSRVNDAYLFLTCHFTTSRWEMVTCVLATPPFPMHHSYS